MSGDIEMSAVQIWEQFCEQLKQAGQVLSRDGLPKDDINLAEGLRHLVRQIRMGFEITCEYADPDFPQIVPANTATMMAEGPTSDCRYHHAFIDGTNTYLLRGKLGTAPLFEFSVYAGKIGLQDESRQISSITETDLIVEPGGHFEIVLSPDEHSGNWLRTDDTTSYLFLRQYTLDWSTTESATYTICKRGIETGKQPLNLEMMSNALEKTAAFVERGPRFWGAFGDQRAAEEPNVSHYKPGSKR
ncbi:MAG: hypothetical protein IPJ33_06920 [Gammaproteobacteria bacterium]|nr:hypothetical protein [Gammaproteobacteria bacterium]